MKDINWWLLRTQCGQYAVQFGPNKASKVFNVRKPFAKYWSQKLKRNIHSNTHGGARYVFLSLNSINIK